MRKYTITEYAVRVYTYACTSTYMHMYTFVQLTLPFASPLDPLILQTAGPCERCVWREVATEEAHGRPGHTRERDTAQDLQKGRVDL